MELFHVLVALEHEGSLNIMRMGSASDHRTLNANGYWVPIAGGVKLSVPLLAWPVTPEGTLLAEQAATTANKYRSTKVTISQIGGSSWKVEKNFVWFNPAIHTPALKGHAVTYNTKSMQTEAARVKFILGAYVVRTVHQSEYSAESKSWSNALLKAKNQTGSYFSLAQYLTGKKAALTLDAIEAGELSPALAEVPSLTISELREAIAFAEAITAV